jgi:hypothetical protein
MPQPPPTEIIEGQRQDWNRVTVDFPDFCGHFTPGSIRLQTSLD